MMNRILILILIAIAILSSAALSAAQHPFIYFKAEQRDEMKSRATTTGTQTANAYASMASGAGSYDGSQASFRRMEELAFRYAVDPSVNAAYGAAAKTLLNAVVQDSNFPPDSGKLSKAWLYATACASTATTYDMIYDLLSPQEKAAVVAELEQWCVNYMAASSSYPRLYTQYDSVNNYPISAHSATFIAALAIEHDSTHPSLQTWISDNRGRILRGAADAVDPDGSALEGYGYSAYGYQLLILGLIADMHAGHGDRFDETNLLKLPDWYAYGWMAANKYPEYSDSHKTDGVTFGGMHLYAIGRMNNEAALYVWHRVRQTSPASSIYSFYSSPYIPIVTFYPRHMAIPTDSQADLFPTAKLFRQNLNKGSDENTAYPDLGKGSLAFMHSSLHGDRVSVFHMIKDEWSNHNHEDDGHFSLQAFSEVFFQDYGYFNGQTSGETRYFGAQDFNHNTISVQGDHFNGDLTKHYNPPNPEGRFYGETLDFHTEAFGDFARGDHAYMWKCDRAERIVSLIKGDARPYIIIADVVRRSNASTYEFNLHTPVMPSGSATFASPLTVSSASGASAKLVMIEPTNHDAPASAAHSHRTPVHNYRTVIQKTAAAGETLGFLTFIQPVKSGTIQPTSMTNTSQVNFSGARIVWADGEDRVLASKSGGIITDGVVETNAAFVVVRLKNNAVVGYLICDGDHLKVNGVDVVAPVNQPPVVDAGNDRSITLPADSVALAGTVADPDDTPTTFWSMVSGPGSVLFDNPSSLNTTAAFTTAGTYSLRLEADDGVNPPVSDTMTVTVITGGTYTIIGSVSGDATSGVMLNLSGASSATTTTDGSGNYSFAGLANGSYTVTPTLSGYTFSPVSRAATVSGANASNHNFAATANTLPPLVKKITKTQCAASFRVKSSSVWLAGWVLLLIATARYTRESVRN